MTSFSAAVQWWEDWQLRLLVLASLFFQYFLFAAAVVRKLRIPHWFRALIWLAYQGGDVVAVYALATLFTRQEALATSNSAHLELLWAPILLLHLGGQDVITAYSIEDNEKWLRHLQVSVTKITVVAIYVFRKSWWSADKILLQAAILLFVPGILKCLEKSWVLMNATVTSIINSSDPRMEATLDVDDHLQKDIYSQAEFVEAAACAYAEIGPRTNLELFVDEVADQPYHLLVDLSHPYSIRLQNLRVVAPRTARADVHDLLRWSLSRAFDRLYTKHKASFSGFSGLLRAAVMLVAFVVIGLFHRSHRGVYDRADFVITYVLLSCTAALELVSACLVLCLGLPLPDVNLAQYNLVSYFARGERHLWFSALQGRLLGGWLQLDRLWCTAAPKPSLDITKLVYDHVACGWKDIGKLFPEYDAATGEWKKKTSSDLLGAYWRFNDSRGQRTLKRERCSRSAVEESLRMPFDESVLLWHLVTEFCYFDHVDTGNAATRHSRTVSNYMAYLLFVKPEMLILSARSKLFMLTYHELRKMLKPTPKDEEAAELEPMEMVRKVIQKAKTGLGSEDLVHKAWAVASQLIEFAKEKEQDFINELRTRQKNRKEVIKVLCCAKEKADEFIDIKNKKRYKVLKNLMELMGSAQKKAEEFIHIQSNNEEEATERKKIFIKDMKEAKEKAESFIKEERAKKQTKEEEEITNFLQYAKNNAEEFIKYVEGKKEADVPMGMEEEREKEKLMVKKFSENANRVIELAKVEKQKLMDVGREAKEKAEMFIYKADKFINEEKNENQTKEEEKMITDLLASAKKKACEFLVAEPSRKPTEFLVAEPSRKPTALEEEKSVHAVEEFSKQAGEAMKLVEEEKEKLVDLMKRNLIANEEELLIIRGREYADDKMWAVIQGVWVEMLCFSAGRCRGYLHARSLSNGGEYLSYVWLLLYYMGMETMPERMQRSELPTVGDTGALVKTPTHEERDEELAQLRRRNATATSTESNAGIPQARPHHIVDIE